MLEDVTVEDESPNLLFGVVKTHNEIDPARRHRDCVVPKRRGFWVVSTGILLLIELVDWLGALGTLSPDLEASSPTR